MAWEGLCASLTSDLLTWPLSSPLTGEAYMRLNKLTEAEHWYKESLRAKPDHIPAHLTYGKLLAMTVKHISKLISKIQGLLIGWCSLQHVLLLDVETLHLKKWIWHKKEKIQCSRVWIHSAEICVDRYERRCVKKKGLLRSCCLRFYSSLSSLISTHGLVFEESPNRFHTRPGQLIK